MTRQNSTISSRKKWFIIITPIILVILLGLVAMLFIQLQNANKATTKVPCLNSGRCLVGVSYSDSIPGFRVKNGKEYFGFDVDVANYLTSRLNRGAPVFVQADRDQSLTDKEKPIHMYVSTVSMTDERLKTMTFVGPYMRTFQGILVSADADITKDADLEHGKICVAEGTTSAESLTEYAAVHPVSTQEEATTEQCITKMKDGEVQAVTGDYVTLQTHAHADSLLKAVPIRISQGYELYGVALPRDSMELCHKLKPLMKDFIREKWEAAFASNLRNLDITYDSSNTTIPSLKPGENLIDSHSCI